MAGERILVGKIVAARGIKGCVKIKSFTSAPVDIFGYPLFAADGAAIEILPKGTGPRDIVIAAVKGVSDRNAAETLKGTELFAPRGALAGKDEVLVSELVGMKVLADGKEIGLIAGTLDYGAGDILEIEMPGRERTAMILLSPDGVPEINKEKGYIRIDPEHLLES